MEPENILASLVRIGRVSAVDATNRKVRVIFPDKGISSGWLHVLRYPGRSIVLGTIEVHTHGLPEGGKTDSAGEHTHTVTYSDWMPTYDDTVVVLYLPIWNGDGFVLGAI